MNDDPGNLSREAWWGLGMHYMQPVAEGSNRRRTRLTMAANFFRRADNAECAWAMEDSPFDTSDWWPEGKDRRDLLADGMGARMADYIMARLQAEDQG